MLKLALALLLALCAGQACAADLVRVIDGDTVVICEKGKEVKCRMAYIDAPEIRQPCGKESKQYLEALLSGGDFEVKTKGRDRYGRTLAVFTTHVTVNLQMVHDGYAWAYRARKVYRQSEAEARAEHKGLWSQATPEAPWEYRKRLKKQSIQMLRDALRKVTQDLC